MLNDTQIGEVWSFFAPYVDKKQIDIVAERYIEMLADNGASDKTLEHATGVDQYLDHGIEFYLDESDDDLGEDELDF